MWREEERKAKHMGEVKRKRVRKVKLVGQVQVEMEVEVDLHTTRSTRISLLRQLTLK